MSAELRHYHKISDTNDADIFLFSAEVDDQTADSLIKSIRENRSKRPNLILILTTLGGAPDAGYRIVRMIKKSYKKFILYVFGDCKSTGTLIALGADEIVMGDYGELGPLDIQLAKDDELTNTSGLSYSQSLLHLNQQLFSFFQNNFLSLKRDFGYSITTRTAAEISSKLSIGIISPIAEHIDPIKLGEGQRAMSNARAYGKRICEDEALIQKLIGGYPSHGFVIDLIEAKNLFKNKCVVRAPTDDEADFENEFLALFRTQFAKPMVDYLETTPNEDEKSEDSPAEQTPEPDKTVTENTEEET